MPYAYAVTGADAGVPEVRGLALQAVHHGALAALVGDAPGPLEGDQDALWRHEEVVEAAMARGPVLPMRFASVVDDAGAFLDERHDELAAALERVRGAVELAVRAVDAVAAEPPRTGTEYLLGRAEAAATSDRVHAALGALSRASVRRARAAHVGAYLVDRDAVERFRAAVGSLDARLVCTGPWPPYSFVTP